MDVYQCITIVGIWLSVAISSKWLKGEAIILGIIALLATLVIMGL